MDYFVRNTEIFVDWLEKIAKIKVSPKIKIKDLRSSNQGRAVVAIQKLKKDETLFEVPRSSILNVATSKLITDHPCLKEKFLNEIGSWEGLIVCILYEMEVLKEKSQWAPYFKVWNKPKDMNTLMFWDNKELEFLQPSLVLERIGENEAKVMHENIVKLVKQIGGEFAKAAVHFGFDEFVYIASIILSYSFDVEIQDRNTNRTEEDDSDDEETKGECYLKSMIPLADTLNADTRKWNANLTYDSGSLKMIAVRDIEENEQVYNIYGEHPNSEILRRYGYVEWDGSKYDFGEVLLENIVETLRETFNVGKEFLQNCMDILRDNITIQELLEGEDIVLNSYDCYLNGELLPQSIVLVQILTILCQIPDLCLLDKKKLERQVERVVKKCLQLIEGGRATDNCSVTWQLCIRNRLADYSLQKSDALKKSSEEEDSLAKGKLRKVMAQRVLQSEIESLWACDETISRDYQIIPDQKLLTNVLKRKLTRDEENSIKRLCLPK